MCVCERERERGGGGVGGNIFASTCMHVVYSKQYKLTAVHVGRFFPVSSSFSSKGSSSKPSSCVEQASTTLPLAQSMATAGVISSEMAAIFAVPQITSKERLPSSASTSRSLTEHEFIVALEAKAKEKKDEKVRKEKARQERQQKKEEKQAQKEEKTKRKLAVEEQRREKSRCCICGFLPTADASCTRCTSCGYSFHSDCLAEIEFQRSGCPLPKLHVIVKIIITFCWLLLF